LQVVNENTAEKNAVRTNIHIEKLIHRKFPGLLFFLLFLLILALISQPAVAVSEPELVGRAVSDSSGDFSFSGLPDGVYNITAVKPISMGPVTHWYAGTVTIALVNGESRADINISMSELDAAAAQALQDAIQNSTLLTLSGSASVSGQTLGPGMMGGTTEYDSVTVGIFRLPDETEKLVGRMKSDLNGEFLFDGLPDGEYNISAFKPIQMGMGGSTYWFVGTADVTIEGGVSVSGINISLAMADEASASLLQDRVLNSTLVDVSGSASVSGATVGMPKPGEGTDPVPYNDTLVGIFKKESNQAPVIPAADFEVNISSGYAPLTVQFTDLSKNASSWQWDFGDGENSTERNPVHVYDSVGTYRVKFTVRNGGESSTKTMKNYIVSELPLEYRDKKILFLVLGSDQTRKVCNAVEAMNLSNVDVYGSYRENTVETLYTPFADDIDVGAYDTIFIGKINGMSFLGANLQDHVSGMMDEKKEGALVVDWNYGVGTPGLLDDHPYIDEYWINPLDGNMGRLLTYLSVVDLSKPFSEYGGSLEIETPALMPDNAIYHPDSGEVFADLSSYLEWYANDDGTHHVYDPSNYTVGITYFRANNGELCNDVEKEVIKKFEDRGINTIPVFQPVPLYTEDAYLYFKQGDEWAVDAFVDLGNGVWRIVSDVRNPQYLEEAGVPVINCITYTGKIEEWENSTNGQDGSFQYQIPIMEIAGEIESIVVGARVYSPLYDTYDYQPIDYQIDWMINRTVNWMDLRETENRDKKVAIIYYCHGKQGAFVASNLDVAPSIPNLLAAMNESGYDLAGADYNSSEFLDLVLKQGRNIGTWAPGELEKMVENYDVELLPVETYLEWFSELEPDARQSVLDTWGEPPGEVMVYENETGKYFVFPKVPAGNVVVMPQPVRGTSQNDTLLYHDQTVPPNHQYIAFYLWLQHAEGEGGFGTDAVVHFGRHGTQEWLQGKGVGLSVKECWPAILIGDMPVVYLYDVGGIGEGITAKRRGNCVIVDHATPPIVRSGLYGNLTLLDDKMDRYEDEEDPNMKAQYRLSIIELYDSLGFETALGASALDLALMNETEFDSFLESSVHDYLHELADSFMPYGFHVLGEVPDDRGVAEMVKSLLGDEFEEHVRLICENPEDLDTFESPNLLDTVLNDTVINASSPLWVLENRFNVSGTTVTTVLSNSTTNESGYYEFSDLEDGEYTVYAVQQAGPGDWKMDKLELTVADAGDLSESNMLLVDDHEELESVLDLLARARLIGDATVSGRITSGTRSGGTMNQPDSVLVLKRGGRVFETIRSGPEGLYGFSDVPDGDYTLTALKFIAPMNSWLVNSTAFTVESGMDVSGLDLKMGMDYMGTADALLPELSIASVSGNITYLKVNGDQAPGTNATLVLKRDGQVVEIGEAGSTGNYAFSDLANGQYTLTAIREVYDPESSSDEYWVLGETDFEIASSASLSNVDILMERDLTFTVEDVLSGMCIGSISGNVTGSSGGPGTPLENKPDALVVLLKGGEYLSKTFTDGSGEYGFSGLADGAYSVVTMSYVEGMGAWVIDEASVEVEYGQSVEDLELTYGLDENNRAAEVLGLMKRGTVSGTVYSSMPPVAAPDCLVVITCEKPDLTEEQRQVVEDLELGLEYAEAFRGSVIEIQRILDGLDGKYIPPGLGDDPLRSPEVMPTGRNFYAFNPNLVPSQEAYGVGKILVDQFLEDWQEAYGEGVYPEKVAFVLWSSESMRHKGIMESEILYLLGVEPEWDSSGKVTGVRLIDSETLGRPRIDVVVTMSGIYRDNWKWQVQLLDRGVRLAAGSDDSVGFENYVKEHSDAIYQALLETGNYSDSEAREISMCRVFGPDEGMWGVSGFRDAVDASGSWENESQLAELYIGSMGHAYGDTIWGIKDADAFREVLSGTDAVLFSRSGNDNRGSSSVVFDHVYEFFGGLGMAVRDISGETPEMFIVDLKDTSKVQTQTFAEYLAKDLLTKYYNPKYIEGLMQHGYSGAAEFDSIFEDFWGLTVTLPDEITDEMWKEFYDIYIEDKYDLGLDEWFAEENPWAKQSMDARMLEAIRKGYWEADQETINDLVKEYVESVAKNDVTCCHHTCGNALLDEYIQGAISVPGVVDKQTAEKYKELMQEATHRELTQSGTSSSSHSSHSTGSATVVDPASGQSGNQTAESDAGYGTSVEQSPAPSKGSEQASNYVEGYEMTKETVEKESGGMSFSGADIVGTLFVLAAAGAIFVGFRKKKL